MYSSSDNASRIIQLKKPFRKRFKSWLNRRIPPQSKITLTQKSIFIFPTRIGFIFLLLLFTLLLLAINYENSLIFGLAFWLGSVFFIAIFYTFKNLAKVSLELNKCGEGFVGEDIEFGIMVSRPENSKREGVQLGWPNQIKQWAELYETRSAMVQCFFTAEKRGWLNPGRLLIETFYPLGLFRAWTWVDLNAQGLVYPKPIFADYPAQSSGSRMDGTLIDPAGSEDFTDLRTYQRGDPLKHVLWRSYAKSDELMVKNYASYVEPRLWFDLDNLAGGTEERLSRMAGLALKAVREDLEFGARIGPRQMSPAKGQLHFDQVLRELAMYGVH